MSRSEFDQIPMYVSTVVTSQTLIGGYDNPNCFSLACSARAEIRIVNMKLGPYERVAAEFLTNGRVLVQPLSDRIALIVDERVPKHELLPDGHFCRVCCPFVWLPEDQQREILRYETPHFKDGRVCGWVSHVPRRDPASDEVVDALIALIKAAS